MKLVIAWSPLACGLILVGMAAAQDEPPIAPGREEPLGSIRGFVKNIESGQPVSGAQVDLVEPLRSTRSAPDGSFELSGVPAGERQVQVISPGLSSTRVTIVVLAGQPAEVTIELRASQRPKVVAVTGPLNLSSSQGFSLELIEKPTGGDGLSRREMQATAGGTADRVLSQISGVSTVDKFAYVRGLGDRYSQTLLNGASVPSPEPDRRAIPLDLFPTNLLNSIFIAKTYSPDFPGEFSGGSVQIKTVGVPDAPFLSFGSDIKYRYRTTFRDFRTYHGGNLDAFSLDDGTRALPGRVPQEAVSEGSGLTENDIQLIGRSFNNIWTPDTTTAPVDHKTSLSFGYRLGQKGDQSLGIVGAVNWANRYQTVLGESRRIVVNTGTLDKPDPNVFSDFKLDSSTFEAELSGLINIVYELNEGQRFGVRTLYTRTASDEVREQEGIDGQRPAPVRVTRLRYTERSLLSVQPFGEHLLAGDNYLEWRLGYALSQRDEPDNRQVRYMLDTNRNLYQFEPSQGSGRRDFFLLDENIYDGSFDYSIPFNPFGVPDKNPNPDRNDPEQKLKLGPAVVHRKRDFDARRFVFEPAGGSVAVDTNGIPIDFYASPEEIFQDKNLNPRGLVVTEATRNTDNYEANQTILAGYGLWDFRLIERLRVQGGLRYEDSVQEVTTTELFANDGEADEVETELKTKDFLPALNLIWELFSNKHKDERTQAEYEESLQIRLGCSQTVSRPEFRELAPFEYTDVQGGYAARGNPDLQRAKILNADIGCEWYIRPGELLNAGFFYKQFDSPIETVNVPLGASLLTTWENADKADLFGFEVEARKSLAFVEALSDLRDFGLITNFTWMESEVQTESGSGVANLQTNKNRPLQGMPQYLVNLGLNYENKDNGWTVTVLANTFGERISAVGASGIDDEKEQSRWSLDISVIKSFGNGNLKITAENLLDDKYEFKQGGISTREYRRGFALGIGYSLTF